MVPIEVAGPRRELRDLYRPSRSAPTKESYHKLPSALLEAKYPVEMMGSSVTCQVPGGITGSGSYVRFRSAFSKCFRSVYRRAPTDEEISKYYRIYAENDARPMYV